MYDSSSSVQKYSGSSHWTLRAKLYFMDERRRYAKEESLPQREVELLRSLTTSKKSLYCRARQLFEAGWTLQAIGNAFSTPFRRSTVQYWVKMGDFTYKNDQKVPFPADFAPKRGYQRKKPVSPGISEADAERLRYLAPLARSFRSGMGLNSPQGSANRELTELATFLHSEGVSVAELARAAGVTFRAMARRLGK